MRIGSNTIPVQAPVVIYYRAGSLHGVAINSVYDRWNVCFWPESIFSWLAATGLPAGEGRLHQFDAPLFSQYRYAYTALSAEACERLDALFTDIEYEMDQRTLYSCEIVVLRLWELALLFQRLQAANETSSALATTYGGLDIAPANVAADQADLFELTTYIEGHLSNDLTAKSLKEALHSSESKIHHLIRSGTGLSLRNYVKQRRVEHARRLLETTDMSIKHVAAAVGIADLSQFWRAFRELCGKIPTHYRSERVAPEHSVQTF